MLIFLYYRLETKLRKQNFRTLLKPGVLCVFIATNPLRFLRIETHNLKVFLIDESTEERTTPIYFQSTIR